VRSSSSGLPTIFQPASTETGPPGRRHIETLQLTVAEAERFARDARADLRRLQAALRLAKEEVAPARLALAKAERRSLKHALTQFPTPAFGSTTHPRVTEAESAADRQLPLRGCIGAT
jgi:hypothetical protein